MARPGGVLLPPGVGFPPSLVGLGEKEGGEREEGKGGCPPHPIWIRLGGVTSTWPPPPLSHYGRIRPIYFPGGSRNLRVLRYMPELTREDLLDRSSRDVIELNVC